ncbi:MAG TPA: DNA starvation/stationary phase protection protein [Patescibacteria group bacterium]|jgi:starvation-inducible DNA-binding protein|nr:DNA starvation/stationary phase protection protein [Patescibacteria group bacterium]
MVKKSYFKIITGLSSLLLATVLGMLFAMDGQPELTTDDSVQNEQEIPLQEPSDTFGSETFSESEDTDALPASEDEFENNTEGSENIDLPAPEKEQTTNNVNASQNMLPPPPTPMPVPRTTNIQPTMNALPPTANELSIRPKSPTDNEKYKESNTMSKEVSIGISQENRTQMANALQKLLADEYLLYTKTLNFHWNVEGKHFGPLHALFNEQYEKLLSIIDNIAERIRAIGSFTHATMKGFLSLSTLAEKTGDFPDDITMLSLLLADHEAVIQTIRGTNDLATKLNDAGSNNFLSGLLEIHEKIAWMLRAHLNK